MDRGLLLSLMGILLYCFRFCSGDLMRSVVAAIWAE